MNIDSQAPNKVVGEWLATKDYTFIKPEYKYGDSRLDFYMEKGEEKYLMEVKGCVYHTVKIILQSNQYEDAVSYEDQFK